MRIGGVAVRSFMLWCLVFAAPSAVAAAPADAHEPPAGAVEYLPTLRREAEYTVRSEPHAYGFSDPVGTIELGELHGVYRPGKSLRDPAESPAADALAGPDEWVAPVLEDGIARNVIGMYEQPNGKFSFSTLGYGTRLAAALPDVDHDSRLLYTAPVDAWYAVSAARVEVLSPGNTDATAGQTMTWREFVEHHTRHMDAMMPDGTGSSAPARTWIVIAVAVAAAVVCVRVAERVTGRGPRGRVQT